MTNIKKKSITQQSLVILLCALYGSVFVFGKLALEYSTPLFVTAARMLIAGTLLLIYQYAFNKENFKVHKRHWVPIIVIAVSGVYLTNAFEFYGLKYMEAGKACFLYSFNPIATALIMHFFFGDKLNIIKWSGLVLGILGFLPMLLETDVPNEEHTRHFASLSLAELAVLIAAVTSAVGWIAMQRAVKTQRLPAFIVNGLSMIIGGIISLIHSYLVDNWDPVPVQLSHFWDFIPWFIILMIISNLISYNLNAVLLKKFSATYMALAGLTQPLFAALFGWIFIGEVVSSYFWVSIVMVSFGLIIYYRAERLPIDLFDKPHKK